MTKNCLQRGPAKIMHLARLVREAEKTRSKISAERLTLRQKKKHVSLALRFKKYLQEVGAQQTPRSTIDFLEKENAIRRWHPGSRSTNWGNMIGCLRRGKMFGLNELDLLKDAEFKDARDAVSRQANEALPSKPPTIKVANLVRIANASEFSSEEKLALVLGTCMAGRMGDILQLRAEAVEWKTTIAPDCVGVTFY